MRERCKIFFTKGEDFDRTESSINKFLEELEGKSGMVTRVEVAVTNTTTVGMGFYVRK